MTRARRRPAAVPQPPSESEFEALIKKPLTDEWNIAIEEVNAKWMKVMADAARRGAHAAREANAAYDTDVVAYYEAQVRALRQELAEKDKLLTAAEKRHDRTISDHDKHVANLRNIHAVEAGELKGQVARLKAKLAIVAAQVEQERAS